ncbi:MAG: hypothetical protein COZ57_03745 [Armatimonadetes bacterium CG_4_8_14_3_um_filter_66_20]|nr:MAG: hypothetical protein COZ57_03745 [Armatimonadetes bacterium CG_4_8_14_3_um_filter_66_20]
MQVEVAALPQRAVISDAVRFFETALHPRVEHHVDAALLQLEHGLVQQPHRLRLQVLGGAIGVVVVDDRVRPTVQVVEPHYVAPHSRHPLRQLRGALPGSEHSPCGQVHPPELRRRSIPKGEVVAFHCDKPVGASGDVVALRVLVQEAQVNGDARRADGIGEPVGGVVSLDGFGVVGIELQPARDRQVDLRPPHLSRRQRVAHELQPTIAVHADRPRGSKRQRYFVPRLVGEHQRLHRVADDPAPEGQLDFLLVAAGQLRHALARGKERRRGRKRRAHLRQLRPLRRLELVAQHDVAASVLLCFVAQRELLVGAADGSRLQEDARAASVRGGGTAKPKPPPAWSPGDNVQRQVDFLALQDGVLKGTFGVHGPGSVRCGSAAGRLAEGDENERQKPVHAPTPYEDSDCGTAFRRTVIMPAIRKQCGSSTHFIPTNVANFPVVRRDATTGEQRGESCTPTVRWAILVPRNGDRLRECETTRLRSAAATENPMTHVGRFRALMNSQPVDRLPRWEWAMWWDRTIANWKQQGLPHELESVFDISEYFGLDPYQQFWFSTTDPTIAAVQHHVEGVVSTMEDYLRVRPNLFPDHTEAIESMRPWAGRQARGEAVVWITLEGYFWFPRTLMGFNKVSLAFYDQPELIHRINQDLTDFNLRILTQVERACVPTFATLAEDMSYNHGPMLSERHFDEYVAPYYRQLLPRLCERNVLPIVDTDGDVTAMVPWLQREGVRGVLPLERQAGVDGMKLRRQFPDFCLIGHFNKMVMDKGEEALRQEFERLLPLMRTGGFLPSVDHQTPPHVTLEQYRVYRRLLDEYTVRAAT